MAKDDRRHRSRMPMCRSVPGMSLGSQPARGKKRGLRKARALLAQRARSTSLTRSTPTKLSSSVHSNLMHVALDEHPCGQNGQSAPKAAPASMARGAGGRRQAGGGEQEHEARADAAHRNLAFAADVDDLCAEAQGNPTPARM